MYRHVNVHDALHHCGLVTRSFYKTATFTHAVVFALGGLVCTHEPSMWQVTSLLWFGPEFCITASLLSSHVQLFCRRRVGHSWTPLVIIAQRV